MCLKIINATITLGAILIFMLFVAYLRKIVLNWLMFSSAVFKNYYSLN